MIAEMVKETATSNCTWQVLKVVKIPKQAFFLDYSGAGT